MNGLLWAVALSSLLTSAVADQHTTGLQCGNNTSSSHPDWATYGIIFKYTSLSFDFLVNNSLSVVQVCTLSGPMVAHALGINEKDPKAIRILPIHTHAADQRGYVAAAVMVSVPNNGTEKKLNEAIRAPESALYQHPTQLVRDLAAQVDANESVIVGECRI